MKFWNNKFICKYLGFCESYKPHIFTGAITAAFIGLTSVQFIPSYFKLAPILFVAAILIPVILGMLGKIGFKWVVLWESIMFFPVVLIVAIVVFLVKR